MSMSFGLGAKLSTSQKLTPQMQQAIKLLQMSSLELAQEVQMKLDSNPMLEREEDHEDALDHADGEMDEVQAQEDSWQSDGSIDNKNDSSDEDYGSDGVDTLDKLQQDGVDDAAVDTDWEDVYTHEPTGLARPDYEEMDDYQGNTSANIQDHVRWQLNFKHLSDTDVLIADYLVDAMNELGFIELDFEELEQSFATMASFYQWDSSIEADEIEAVLHIIQSCDPVGVGARDLAECLQLQLHKLPAETPYRTHALKVLKVSHHLVSNNIKALLDETGLSQQDLPAAIELIRTLNPSPGLAFMNSQAHYDGAPESYDIPDVLVAVVQDAQIADNEEDDGAALQWQVRLNPDTLPKLRINQEYASLVKRGDDSSDNQYLREHLTDARLFIRSIEERNQNLLKVATCIVRRQQAFLQQGATAMQPMILKDVAEEVELHESTVSRLTTSKSILTPQGLYSLKYFFSSHVAGSEGEVSSTAISAMIEKMIADENPKKPLSDSAIMKRLQDDGIDIARRTVAKYREAMNIGSSTQRKQKF